MRHLRSLLTAIVVAAVLTGAGVRGASAAGPTLTMSPSSAAPTIHVTAAGSGFGANEAVDVYFDTTDIALAATDATGAFSVGFAVPKSAQPGLHYVSAVGRHSGLAAQVPWTVRTSWGELGFGASRLDWNPYENTLNTGNVSQLDETLEATVSSSALNSASIANGVAYIASQDDNVYAINVTTGAQRWMVATGAPVTSAPAVSGGVVYFGSQDGSVYAVNAYTGVSVWTDNLSTLEPSGFYSSPAVVGGSVYITGDSGSLYSLSTSNGFATWATPASGGPAWSAPAVNNGHVFYGAGDTLYAVSVTGGTPLWNVGVGGLVSGLAVSNGVVYVSTFGSIDAYETANGHQLWSYSPNSQYINGISVVAGVLYAGANSSGGYPNLYAVNTQTGSAIWQDTLCSYGGINPAPALANGVLYDTCGAGEAFSVLAVDPGGGSQLWSASTGGACGGSTNINGTVMVVNGTVDVPCGDGTFRTYGLAVQPAAAQRPDPRSLHPDLTLKIS